MEGGNHHCATCQAVRKDCQGIINCLKFHSLEATSQRKTGRTEMGERLSQFSRSLFVRSTVPRASATPTFLPRPCAILEQQNALLQSHSYSRGLCHRMLPIRAADLGASVLPWYRFFLRAVCTPCEFEAETQTDER